MPALCPRVGAGVGAGLGAPVMSTCTCRSRCRTRWGGILTMSTRPQFCNKKTHRLTLPITQSCTYRMTLWIECIFVEHGVGFHIAYRMSRCVFVIIFKSSASKFSATDNPILHIAAQVVFLILSSGLQPPSSQQPEIPYCISQRKLFLDMIFRSSASQFPATPNAILHIAAQVDF